MARAARKGGRLMPLMSRKVDYALLILAHLHERPEGTCARRIAERFGLSRAFIANILKELCHQGFVASQRGIKGGYALSRPVEAIALGELLEALDEPFRLAECTEPRLAEGCCLAEVCPVKGPIAEVHARILEVLHQVTLADLFRTPREPLLEQVGLLPAVRSPEGAAAW